MTELDAIRFQDVTFSHVPGEAFMEGLCASFPHGAVTSIVGPNGCGKSTMVKLADGLLRPRSGEVFVDGEPTLSLGARQRARRLAVLAQAGRPPAMTVESLVACGRYPHLAVQGRLSERDRLLIERAMEVADVTRFRNCDVRQLSGGERQRAFIAMTLAQDTRIIVLDEPTTYLDICASHELMQLIRRLNEDEGKTIVMVIHDIDLALRYSDRLLVMERGCVVCAGSVGEALDHGAVERAFGMRIFTHEAGEGRGYILYPQASTSCVLPNSSLWPQG